MLVVHEVWNQKSTKIGQNTANHVGFSETMRLNLIHSVYAVFRIEKATFSTTYTMYSFRSVRIRGPKLNANQIFWPNSNSSMIDTRGIRQGKVLGKMPCEELRIRIEISRIRIRQQNTATDPPFLFKFLTIWYTGNPTRQGFAKDAVWRVADPDWDSPDPDPTKKIRLRIHLSYSNSSPIDTLGIRQGKVLRKMLCKEERIWIKIDRMRIRQ